MEMRLPRDQKTLDLRIFEVKKLFTGSNYNEVAKIVGLNRSTIYNALNRFEIRAKKEPDFLARYNSYINTNMYIERVIIQKDKKHERPNACMYKHYKFVGEFIIYIGTGTKIHYKKPFTGKIVQLWNDFKNAKTKEQAFKMQRKLNQFFMNIDC